MKSYYHFTSLENWKSIKKSGKLKRYKMRKGVAKFSGDRLGIFLWINKIKGESLAGTIFWQIGNKNTNQIVELKVKTNKSGFIFGKNERVFSTHYGEIGDYEYHIEEARIYYEDIPLEDIELVRVYKLGDAFK